MRLVSHWSATARTITAQASLRASMTAPTYRLRQLRDCFLSEAQQGAVDDVSIAIFVQVEFYAGWCEVCKEEIPLTYEVRNQNLTLPPQECCCPAADGHIFPSQCSYHERTMLRSARCSRATAMPADVRTIPSCQSSSVLSHRCSSGTRARSTSCCSTSTTASGRRRCRTSACGASRTTSSWTPRAAPRLPPLAGCRFR